MLALPAAVSAWLSAEVSAAVWRCFWRHFGPRVKLLFAEATLSLGFGTSAAEVGAGGPLGAADSKGAVDTPVGEPASGGKQDIPQAITSEEEDAARTGVDAKGPAISDFAHRLAELVPPGVLEVLAKVAAGTLVGFILIWAITRGLQGVAAQLRQRAGGLFLLACVGVWYFFRGRFPEDKDAVSDDGEELTAAEADAVEEETGDDEEDAQVMQGRAVLLALCQGMPRAGREAASLPGAPGVQLTGSGKAERKVTSDCRKRVTAS